MCDIVVSFGVFDTPVKKHNSHEPDGCLVKVTGNLVGVVV